MNILPKKRWHVRTKENIARVRKDEAEAAEKERQERLRIENADREARINVLKQKSKQRILESGIIETESCQDFQTPPPLEHINFFADIEHAVSTTNKEHDKEVKEKKEEYEKKIGYLTYLGQDTNEAVKKKNWYEVAPGAARFSRSSDIKDTYDKLVLKDTEGKPRAKELDDKSGEVSWKSKQRLDPINAFKEFCHGHKTKPIKALSPDMPKDDYTKIIADSKSKYKNKHKKNKKDKELKLQKLREARLKREQQEKRRTEMFLSGLHGEANTATVEKNVTKLKPKYNSQFNPELARQNYT